MNDARAVIDTGVLISRLIRLNSIPGQADLEVLTRYELLMSHQTFAELNGVSARPKLQRFIKSATRTDFLAQVQALALSIPVVSRVYACRDPKDNMILELAVDGQAHLIPSGDDDLLSMKVLSGIPIVSPRRFPDLRANV